MTNKEAMQMALDALVNWDARSRLRVIEALRAALAQPERKPLSDEEMFAVFDDWSNKPEVTMGDLCRAIEAAHNIG